MATGYQSKFKGSEVDEYLSYAKKLKEDGLDLSDYAKKEDLKGKQDTISDLEEIREGASKGATALQKHQDISHLATKESVANKVDKIDGKGLSTEDFTTALKNKLAGLNNYDDSDVRKLISQKQDTITDLEQIREGANLGSTALQEHQDISHLATKEDVTAELKKKQDVIIDLPEIREGASKGATALQEHQDISHLAEKSAVEKVSEDVAKHGEDITALQTLTEEQGTLAQESKSRLDVIEPIVTELSEEVEILTGTGEGSVVDIASKEVAKVIDSAPETMDTLKKIADLIEKDAEQAADILATLGDHENRISTLEDKFVVMSEAEYNALPNKEDKFYFCYDE